ncbi:MAG: PIN domain-containing protein [Chthoniobacteraceae bacterium]
MSAARVVLDSFALIAYFRGEPSAAAVRDLLQQAVSRDTPALMSEVNYAEVKYQLLRKKGAAAWAQAAAMLTTLPIEFHPATRALADVAADFKARYKLSLADAFAAALAKERKAELITGDPEFKALEKEIKIGWLR